ncbi:Sodium/hydrogen exchanger 7 [Morella rubra]|uniref:Sodium/hydrogen exchanger 7 n=1 Tax=Morella rubra TaxID=262757 RepID=A0A6A1W897_9ROSI|nr:Sodium/hydrogen exchanger 7 [Morella rubra]
MGRKLIHSATNHEKIPEAKVYPLQYVVKISAPVLVIKMECSNCAAGLPSADTAVQLSGQVMQSMLPSTDLKKLLRNPPLVKIPKMSDMISVHPLLGALPSSVRSPLQGSTRETVKLRGVTLYKEGSKANGIWLISNGVVKVGKKLALDVEFKIYNLVILPLSMTQI